MSKLRFITSAAEASSKAGWITKAFKGVSSLVSGAGRFLSGPWVGAAFLGLEVYDFFSEDGSDENAAQKALADAGRTRDVMSILYPQSIRRALTNQISDANAVSQGFAQAFLDCSNSVDPLAKMRAISYAAISDYLNFAPDVSNILYSPIVTADLLKELTDVMASDADEETKKGMEELALSAEDVASAPLSSRRILDFTAHLVKNFKQEVSNE